MSRFKVFGVRRETGTDIGLVVDAIDEIEAIEKARKLGVLAERCEFQRRPIGAASTVTFIEMVCPSCGTSIRVKDGHSNEAGKCKCGGTFVAATKRLPFGTPIKATATASISPPTTSTTESPAVAGSSAVEANRTELTA